MQMLHKLRGGGFPRITERMRARIGAGQDQRFAAGQRQVLMQDAGAAMGDDVDRPFDRIGCHRHAA